MNANLSPILILLDFMKNRFPEWHRTRDMGRHGIIACDNPRNSLSRKLARGASGKVVGVITDRDICIAVGTRYCLPGDLTVREVMSNRLFACSPDCSVHAILRIMEDGGVRRLPVIADDGSLVGVISMDDRLLKSEPAMTGIKAEPSTDEVVQAYRAFGQRRRPQMVLVNAA